jgi:hypothetical protein
MYSSIEEENRKEVIDKCYWPIFDLVKIGIPVGLEAPGVTLEIINDIDSAWIKALSQNISSGKIEFIGSGYSQIIGPLVPTKVNEWNQELGLEHYKKLLGVTTPILALVNEMAYSGGIVEHYINSGYEGIIMEWNNSRSVHPKWKNEWRYYPQKVVGGEGKTIPLIWADSIAFQKYQRYAHGEYDLGEYVEYIKTHIGDSDRFFPLYSNDIEIFNYRPGRYQTEAQFDDNSEWDRIIKLYTYLNKQDWCEFVFPSHVLHGLNNENGGQKLKLESSVQPIPVKKQEKYNINRWALTGRDDIGINSKCFQVYNSFIQDGNNNPKNWKELCYLWSSDFRTHITKKRWIDYKYRLDDYLFNWDSKVGNTKQKLCDKIDVVEDDNIVSINNSQYKVILNKNKGLSIQGLLFTNVGEKFLLGTLDHGYYDDISLGADYYSGHAVFERPGEHKVTDLGKVKPEIIESDNGVIIKINQKWGAYYFSQHIIFNNDRITFEKNIEANNIEKAISRPFSYTFNPESWDKGSLYIKTFNGGSNCENFFLDGQNISHNDIYSSLISARHGFGNTEGIFIVGDKNKKLTFTCDMSVSALIPSIIYREMEYTYFFRLHYSAREIDETLNAPNPSKYSLKTKIIIQ